MLFSFENPPEKVKVSGIFNPSCKLELSEQSFAKLETGELKISIARMGSKPIHDLNIKILAIGGHINIGIGDNGSQVVFEDLSSGNYNIILWRASNIKIGKRTTSNGCKIICDFSDFETGEDCMFSDEVIIQTSDQHGLIDLNTGEIINNRRKKTTLGNHVWIGRRCTLMANINIGNGSIIGTGSIVTKSIPDKTIAAGVPAAIIRTNTTWSRSPTQLDSFSQQYLTQWQIALQNS